MKKAFQSFALFGAIAALGLCLQSFSPSDNDKLTFKSGNDICIVELCSANILKVDYRPNGEVSPGTPVVDETKKWEPVKASINLQKDPVEIRTSAMLVKISKASMQVSVYDIKGNLLLASKEVDPEGGITFKHEPADNFYGVYTYGSHSNDGTLLRNKTSTIQAFPQGGSGAPFIWSTSGYGIVVNTNGGQISNNNGELSFSNCSRKNTEYYIILGTPKEIIKGAGNIAGLPPMFPKWNTGFGQLEWGIDEAELKTHIKNYREKKIPFDWFMLDFDWMAWGEDNFGEVRWGKKFPDGATGELGNWAKANGLKMIGITKPRIILKNADSTDTQQGKYAEEHHFEYPELNIGIDYFVQRQCRTLDFRIPECREWWAGHLIEGAYEKGMMGFLNDEADLRNPGKFGLGNLNNHYMQRAIYEEQRKVGNERVYSINRTAYMGSQKYAYGLWSGDNYPTFTDLKAQCLKLIAANNALIPVWGFCSSAFGNKPKLSNELYVRSLQLAAFSPLFFLHGTLNEQKQPWFFGEKVVNLSREIVNLRYQLIPYAYSYDRVKHESMLGIARSLAVEFP
ncbi:MAG: glycoside hydrolase family 31 protein, partial [Bacteroidota bacterium]|nr:glycoside hydrolase family 31 protein [Bacteroidota bacterium]